MISQAEENYLKAIFKLSEKTEDSISTNSIAMEMKTAAASVTDMVKRLAKNDFLKYEPYRGVRLSTKGDKISRNLVRKHRIWEVFLFDKLNFTWDEVHDLAEHLEHIQSDELINRLEHLLDYPKFDPHGDPIPDKDGKFAEREQKPLSELTVGESGIIVGVREHSKPFLKYLVQFGLILGAEVSLLEVYDFDSSIKIIINKTQEHTITQKVGNNLFVKEN
jgi:DtxR family Mn-dependent transcriptional regulator